MSSDHSEDPETLLALDAGGTMTDSYINDDEGNFVLGKSLTRRENEAKSYNESIDDACKYWEHTPTEVHENSIANIYTGTAMLNAVLEGEGDRVGLLTTRGQEAMYEMERGLTWLGQSYSDIVHQKTHHHKDRFNISRNLIQGVTERIGSGSYFRVTDPGEVKIPLNEDEVATNVGELLDEGAESIAIVFLFSYLNGEHEQRAKEIAKDVISERDKDVSVVTSSELVPVLKENQRLQSTLIEAFAAEPVRKEMHDIENAAQEMGNPNELLTVTSYGTAVNMRHPRLYETVISGPVGGLMGAETISNMLGMDNVFCCDLGGTSFDVGMIIDGKIDIDREPDFAGLRLALPMVSLDSIGAGTGSVVHVDEDFKQIELGPDSAGEDAGICFRYDDVTVTDIDVALGYLNEEFFLGGEYDLDKEKAIQAIEERVAEPLEMDIYEAAEGVLEVLHAEMSDHLDSMLRSRGFEPSDFALFTYGGGGPLHLHGIETDFKENITFPFAGAFSAYGIASADYAKQLQRGMSTIIPPDADSETKESLAQEAHQEWEALRDEAYEEMQEEGFSRNQIEMDFGMQARYMGNIEDIEVDLPITELESASDLDTALNAFEDRYEVLYSEGAKYPESGFYISEFFVRAVADKPDPVLEKYDKLEEEPREKAHKGSRDAFYDGEWQPFAIYDMRELKAGNKIDGPAIIEDPMTTLVIPPTDRIEMDNYRFIHYKEG